MYNVIENEFFFLNLDFYRDRDRESNWDSDGNWNHNGDDDWNEEEFPLLATSIQHFFCEFLESRAGRGWLRLLWYKFTP